MGTLGGADITWQVVSLDLVHARRDGIKAAKSFLRVPRSEVAKEALHKTW